MIPVLTASEMRECDRRTMEWYGVPSCVLMERAACAVAEEAVAMIREEGLAGNVLIFAGNGNNGGDGFACARILRLMGISVTIRATGNPDHRTEETLRQADICSRMGIAVNQEPNLAEYDLIIDAMLGTGLTREVRGDLAEIFESINESGAKVLAVDIASGIDSDTGAIRGACVRADRTVTMQSAKRGHLLYPGAEYTGTLRVAEIGVAFSDELRTALSLDREDLGRLIPTRSEGGNKATFGKLLIVAGSLNMSGAAYLCGLAALRTGSGMVRIVTDEKNRTILQQMLPEAMIASYTDAASAEEEVRKYLSWCDAAACGPGIGTGDAARAAVSVLLGEFDRPLVLDADALNILSGQTDLLKQHRGDVYITPHPGEMSRLCGLSPNEVLADLPGCASAFAKENGIVCVLKDAGTVCAGAEGALYINRSGNSGMATAGSGDVLTGILASLVGQGAAGTEAAALAVYLHGLAGDEARDLLGARSVKAGDIIDGITRVLRTC